jgi:hypothetical protein
MKTILLTLLLTIATSPTYAVTQKQHEHWLMLQQQHREFQLLKKWMGEAEVQCKQYTEDEFHVCYQNALKSIRAKNNIKLSPGTQETFDKLTNPHHKHTQ